MVLTGVGVDGAREMGGSCAALCGRVRTVGRGDVFALSVGLSGVEVSRRAGAEGDGDGLRLSVERAGFGAAGAVMAGVLA
jgi:hypothetical protein